MDKFNTEKRLLNLLQRAAKHEMTPEEIEAQRQSWVRGEMARGEWERSMTRVMK